MMKRKIFIFVLLMWMTAHTSLALADTSRTTRAFRIGSRINGSTPGSLLFIDLNKKIAEDNSNLFWDDINNRLGVGTNSPNSALEINGVIAVSDGTVGAPAFTFTNDTNLGFFRKSADRMIVAAGGGTIGTFYGAGFASGDGTGTKALIARSIGSATVPNFTFTSDQNTGMGASGADAISFITGGVSALFVDSSQNIGIGTIAPVEHLEIEDDNVTTILQISNTATDGDPGWGLALSGVRQWTGYCDDGDGDKFKIDIGNIGGINAVTIDNAANVGMGTTTPTAPLTVVGGMDLILAADDNFTIDGSANQRVITIGAFRQLHTPAMPGTRALNYVIDANNQSDTSAIVTEYKAKGMGNGDLGAIHQVDVDTDNSTGGIIEAWHIEKTGDGAVGVHAVHAGIGVAVLHQDSGSFIAIEKAFIYDDSGASFTDVTTELGSTSSDIQLFVEDNDLLYIGKDTMFEAVEVLLQVVAVNPGIKPEFYYWNGAAWTQFGPADGSNGFRVNGNIKWDADDLFGWTTTSVNSVTKYWVYIKRTTNNLSTPPTENRIRYSTPLEYGWDENGAVNIDSLYFGETDVDGSWRIVRSGDDLVFERRESSSWVEKGAMSP
jgi:hypothetical protein